MKNDKIKVLNNKRFIPLLVAAFVLVVVLLVCFVSKITGTNGVGFGNSSIVTGSSHTVMVYMVGSDLETDYELASGEMKEIEKSGINSKKNNVLVYTGGCEKFAYSGTGGNTIYKLGENGFEAVKNEEAQNMGASDTLSSFLSYCTENYKTDNYELIFWNHGGGPVYGFGKDVNFGYDCLSLSELKEGLSNGLKKSNVKLELIGFDACLMCNVETVAAVKDYARYMVASEETEPGNGWDYSCLKLLNKGKITGETFGREIIDSYYDFYEKNFSDTYQITMSCIDLSEFKPFSESFEALFNQIQSIGISNKFSSISKSRSDTKSFGTFATDVIYDLVDINELIDNLDSSYNEKEKLKASLKKLVSCSKTNMKNATGLSVYFPYKDMVAAQELIESGEPVSFSKSYSEFVKEFFYSFNNGGEFTQGLENEGSELSSDKDKTDFEYILSDKELENFASAKYYIFRKATFVKGDENYCLMFSSNDVTLEGKRLLASYKNKAFYACEGLFNKAKAMPVPLFEDENSTAENRLYTVPIVLQSFPDDITDWDIQPAWLRIKTSDTSDEITVLDAVPNTKNDEKKSDVAPKQLIDIYDYEIVSFPGYIRQPVRYKNGKLKPISEWKSGIGLEGIEVKTKHKVNFKKDFIAIKGEKYYCIFAIKDVHGKTHMSDFIEMTF